MFSACVCVCAGAGVCAFVFEKNQLNNMALHVCRETEKRINEKTVAYISSPRTACMRVHARARSSPGTPGGHDISSYTR